MSNLEIFDSRDGLFEKLAERTAAARKDAIAERGEAHLALSGGSTPRPIYEALSRDDSVDWSKVTVTLVDERMTEPGDPASNEVLVRESLLQNHGAAATFVALEEGATGMPTMDLAILGMGGDGHYASLFPTAEELETALAKDAPDVLRMTPNPLPENAPFPRLTMTLPMIERTRSLVLAITGEEKRDVFHAAHEEGPVREYPIRSLLSLQHKDLFIAWAL